MSNQSGQDRTVLATDQVVGKDGDAPGISQPITQAEIDDILGNSAMTIEEKQARLQAYAGQISSREGADRGSEFEPLEAQIFDALALLADGGHAYGTAESVGLDPDSRSDARAPDDDLSTRTAIISSHQRRAGIEACAAFLRDKRHPTTEQTLPWERALNRVRTEDFVSRRWRLPAPAPSIREGGSEHPKPARVP